MLNEQVVNPVERASPAAIAIHLVEVEIKPEAFIRYFVAAKNNWPTIFLSFMLNSIVNLYQTTKTLSSVSFFALYIA